MLADFGAEVIKVEHPGRGDDTRDWGIRIGKTETTYYNSMNRNKRSITVDLQTPEGQKLIHDLLPQFDVVIQNFKTGGADKLGLGYTQLKAITDTALQLARVPLRDVRHRIASRSLSWRALKRKCSVLGSCSCKLLFDAPGAQA